MKRLIPTLVLFMLFSIAHGQVERDKALHFLGGNLYGLAGAGIAKQLSDGNRFWTFAGSLGGATLIGLGKEAVDSGQRENGWDNDDLLATILGGLSVGVTIDLFTDHKGKRKARRKAKIQEEFDADISLQNNLEESFKVIVDIESLPTLNSLGLSNQMLESLK